jgi:hypothetical protein
MYLAKWAMCDSVQRPCALAQDRLGPFTLSAASPIPSFSPGPSPLQAYRITPNPIPGPILNVGAHMRYRQTLLSKQSPLQRPLDTHKIIETRVSVKCKVGIGCYHKSKVVSKANSGVWYHPSTPFLKPCQRTVQRRHYCRVAYRRSVVSKPSG